MALGLRGLDLNLLVALDALLQDQHVGRAATRVGLSQPAMSHALSRLRRHLGDPLLVRVGLGMRATPRAETLREPLAQPLQTVREVLTPVGFDPQTSRRTFRLMFPDLVTDPFLPRLAGELALDAPGVQFDFVPWRGPMSVTEEYVRSIDLIASHRPDERVGFHRTQFYADKDALAVRKDHPLLKDLASKAGFERASHVAVVGSGEREDPLAGWLAEVGLERRVYLNVPSYLLALRAAAQSDLVAFVPGRLVAATRQSLGLVAVRPPMDPGLDQMYLFHPVRAHTDLGSTWLRRLLVAAAETLPDFPFH